LDPDVEWDASEIPAPDIGGVYRGPEGVRQFAHTRPEPDYEV
jgi:hypothetical protein